ncbi:chaperonin-containing T-complex member BBS12 [Gouania willdenowi]|uniref:Bardet-Biedl syndrome 12 n=1 Tax=Gouania willdenowi TaxID=441366 RepID=A0A8C5GF96_GOUWI|nr:Bardet-Biedl syndrome 12 protein [Gouania willdenowi]
MQECFLLNNQQHVGLQKLSALSATSHSFLGPIKKYKFIQDDTSGESTLVCSSFRIIESLDLTCAVGQLVYETLRSHHGVYHTGCGCLLFLAGAWSRAALECLQKGIPVAHIMSAMSEGMDVCAEVCRKCAIPAESIHSVMVEPITEATAHQIDGKTLNIRERRKLKLSRHFFQDSTQLPPTRQPEFDVPQIAKGLHHGSDISMKLAIEAFRILSDNRASTFDISKVLTCMLPALPEHHSTVVQGCIVLLAVEQALIARRLEEQHLNVALIMGDLSDSYRHLGFTRPKGLQRISDGVASSSREEEWIEAVVSLLVKLQVKLILISGRACENVIQRCCRHQILIVEKLKPSVLMILADSTRAIPVTYPTQLGKDCIGTGAKVTLWKEISSPEGKSTAAVNICSGGDIRLVTVVITGCVQGKLPILEDQFWASAFRLHNALKDGSVLPGAGHTEILCVHHLLKVVTNDQRSKRNPYTNVVLHLMADGLIDYISTVLMNTGRFSKVEARTIISQQVQNYREHPDMLLGVAQLLHLEGGATSPEERAHLDVYDNLSVKLEAWRKALDLVFLVLQTDAEIVTGVAPETDAKQQT